MKKQKKAFTLVELVIVIAIMGILWSIWIVSYTSSLSDTRDSKRIADFGLIKSALKSYHQKRGSYPNPGSPFEIQYSGTGVAFQWKLDNTVTLSTLENLPSDPKNKLNYTYSITKNKQEYQIAATLEWDNFQKALLKWDYKSVSKNILPTIVVATGSILDIQSSPNKDLFVFDNNTHNLVYTFESPYSPKSNWTTLSTLLSEATDSNNFWQNSDFRTCAEIKQAGKLIVPVTNTAFQYQIINNWILTNTWCTISNSN